MAKFNEIINSSPEELVILFYKYDNVTQTDKKLTVIAQQLKLKPEQIICAVGFNPNIKELTEIPPLLGYADMDDLVQDRNSIYINDVYKKLALDNILAIYGAIKKNDEILRVMQYLMQSRLENIENKIEETVSSVTIEKYKAEIKAIYSDSIASIDFTENRLNNINSGFRALVNEVAIIAEHRIIPAGDIFFRDTILPEEKRKLLDKDLIPRELIDTRLEDTSISPMERKMLVEYKQLNPIDDNEN